MQAGDHTLVVTGTGADGRTVTMAIGIVVTNTVAKAAGNPAPKPHGGAWRWLIPVGAFAALILAFLIVWRRRRNGDRTSTGFRGGLSHPVAK